VDACITNGGVARQGEIPMQLQMQQAVNMVTGERRPVNELPQVIAMAGIGHPPRFFAMLKTLGVAINDEVAFADHQQYSASQLAPLAKQDQTLLMTEKDAVKCRSFAQANWWYLPVDAVLPHEQAEKLLQKIEKVINRLSP
jgi:tetraacyldisaccharide 4'-kinase